MSPSRISTRSLPLSFYLRPTLTVARNLLGKFLVRKIGRNTLVGKIVEVEAYLGSKDPASHTYRGKTKRNEVMFLRGGYLYVYFTYGMHFCANVVTGREGVGEAVLIRAVEPVEGISAMRRRRGAVSPFQLTNGPAKLCEAFGIARPENGSDLLSGPITILKGIDLPGGSIGSSTRIGIRRGVHHRWRFYIKNNRWVSKS